MRNEEIEQLKSDKVALLDLNVRLEKKVEKLEEEKASCMSLLGAYEDRMMREKEEADDKGQGVVKEKHSGNYETVQSSRNKDEGDCEEDRERKVIINVSIGKLII